MSKFFKYWFPVILYAGLIFWFSSLPAPSSLSLLPYGDKIGHFLEYALFGFFLFRACKNYGFKRKVFWTVFIGFIYALSDEIHQYFVPGREVS
ncbi:MAG: VanZ family protein, partial [Candidatus Omnitrophica bacterium]|nr:VanZ family protein [Candidatus Omnitrophota bacterium]